MKPTLVFTACCAATFMATGTPARAADAADRFVAEYAPHAGALRAFYTGREVRYRSVVPALSASGRQQEIIYKVRYDHDNYVITDEGSTFTKPGEAPRKTAPSIGGRNRLYSFDIRAKEPAEYAIRKATIFADGRFDPNDAILCPLCFPYADNFLRLTYLELATDPEHIVVQYGDAKWRDGRPVKELKVKKEYAYKGTKTWAFGSYFFDPASGWVCVGNRVQGENDASYSGEVFEYEPAGEALPAIKHWEAWRKEGDGPEIRWQYCDVLEFRRAADFSEAECRLSAFGLPEPVGVKWEKPTRRYVWFLVAAVVFVALAVGFRLLARRRTANAAGEKPNAPPP